MNGVAIIALGNKVYGQYAFNLALSIKWNDNAPIAVIHDNTSLESLSHEQLAYFDHLIECKEDFKGEYQKCKFLLHKLSPFNRTLYIDADSLWCPHHTLDPFLTHDIPLQNNFAISTCGYYNIKEDKSTSDKYMYWGSPYETAKYFNIIEGKMPKTFAGFFIFDKCEAVDRVFERALEVYESNAPCSEWNNGKPDEYCFNVALIDYPLDYDWCPQYFDHFIGFKTHHQIKKEFCSFGMAGHKSHQYIKDLYNSLIKQYGNKRIETFEYVDKNTVLKSREVW